jgi:hypothetical protein
MLCDLSGQGEDTGIDIFYAKSADQKVTYADGVYDLTGRRVMSGTVDNQALRKLPGGIYVIYRNGEKTKIYL